MDAFKKKYPDIAIDVYRGGSTDLGPRLLNEAQAGRFVADALESTPGLLMLLRGATFSNLMYHPSSPDIPTKRKPNQTARGFTG